MSLVTELDQTTRGEGGFGSTDTKMEDAAVKRKKMEEVGA